MTDTVTSPRSARVVATVAMVVGVFAIVPAIVDGAQDTPAAAVGRGLLTADAAGVDALEVSVVDGALAVGFGDVDAATLDVTGSPAASSDWRLDREGSTLRVKSPGAGGWSGEAVLTLPRDAVGLDVSVDADASSVSLDGRFGDVEAATASGSFTAEGGAGAVAVDVELGSADLDLQDGRTATLAVSEGSLTAEFDGAPPRSLVLEASVADIDVTLPDGSYRLIGDAADGRVTDTVIRSTATATNTIDARIADGSVRIETAG